MHRKNNIVRKIALYASRAWAKEKLSVIADDYHCKSLSSINNAIKVIHEKCESDRRFAQNLKKCEAIFLNKDS